LGPKASKIRKRDGRIVDFQQEKITTAISKAIADVKYEDLRLARKLSDEVVKLVSRRFKGKTPGVEDVQDVVEEVLIKNGHVEVAKAYILYRRGRAEIREFKKFYDVIDDLKLGVNATKVLKTRYLLRNEEGHIIETPTQMFRRVARAIAKADGLHDRKSDMGKTEEEFYQVMADREFLPNSPTLMNADTQLGQLSACFVLPVEDSIEGIFGAIGQMAIIHKSGGGTGFSFSRLRPKGDVVGSTKGIASGPVSFMRVFDVATDVIKQGGRRRGANMGILHVTHPDILEFISAKSEEGKFANFNISVAVTDEFMEAVLKDAQYDLVNPRTGEVEKRLRAKDVLDLIVMTAWKSGDPGLIFIDEINRHNPTPNLGLIESTNPCGEQPLLSYESCNLGSINLAKMVNGDDVDWRKLRRVVKTAVHFLDNVIDVNKYPSPEIEKLTKTNRKIGLGVMGFADMLIQLRVPYNSEKGLAIGAKVMKFIDEEAKKESAELGRKRGSFRGFEKSIWKDKGLHTLRNAAMTTIAPTGSISIVGGCSSGIEPLFAIAFVRNVMSGTRLLEIQPLFEQFVRKRGLYNEEMMSQIAKTGSIQNLKELPKDFKKVFVTALDIAPEWHVRIQAAFQKHVDNAVSKTVNLPADATPDDVRKVLWLAYKLKCKGVTVYRYGCRSEQVLYVGPMLEKKMIGEGYASADSEYAGGCPVGTCPF
jgi:ribonucleoside-diphosphate reductase alpha chain